MKEANEIELGKRIRSAREKLNMSQHELYRKTNISTTQISAYENGKKNIGLHSLAKIAEALHLSLDELYFGQPSSKPINRASNEGELVVNCVNALFEKEVVKMMPHEEQNDPYGEVRLVYDIGFSKYSWILEDLIEKLDDYENKKHNYPDPEGFKKQLLASAAKQINESPERNR